MAGSGDKALKPVGLKIIFFKRFIFLFFSNTNAQNNLQNFNSSPPAVLKTTLWVGEAESDWSAQGPPGNFTAKGEFEHGSSRSYSYSLT